MITPARRPSRRGRLLRPPVRLSACVPLLLALALATAAAAQETRRPVAGRVLQVGDGQPVGGAVVEVLGTTLRTTSGRDGHFSFPSAPAGPLSLRAARVGYRPATVALATGTPGGGDPVLITLEPAAVVVTPLVVTATRHAQLSEESPVSVSVATAEDVRRRATIGADEAIGRVPGVQILDGQINIRGSSGFAKGLGSRVLLLVDGAPAIQGDRGGINWDLLPITEIERVEVLKGTGSALYGSAALGGVVNLLTRDIPDRPEMRTRVLFGAYANPLPEWRWRASRALFGGVDYTGTLRRGAASGLFSAGAFRNDGYRENNDDQRYRGFAKLTYTRSATFRAELAAAAVREDYGSITLWCVRGRCSDRGLAYQPFRADSATLGDRVISDKYLLHATARRVLSPALALRGRLSWYQTAFVDAFRAGTDRSRADRFGFEVAGEWRPAATRTLSAGTEATYSRVTSDLFGDHAQTELAWYAESEAPIAGTGRATLGVRLDAIAVDGRGWSAFVSPRLGLTWRLPAVRLRASLGRGFRAPALAERFTSTTLQGFRVIPNPNLENETSWGGELGASTAPARWAILDAALFWSEYDGLIEPGLITGGTEIRFRNVTRVRVRGLDAALYGSLVQGRLGVTLAYTYLDGLDLDTDSVLAFRSPHLVTMAADLTLGALTVGAEGRFSRQPERVEIYQADTRVDAQTVDLRVSWRRGNYGVIAKVENVLNYTFTLVPRTLEAPRAYSVAVSIRQ